MAISATLGLLALIILVTPVLCRLVGRSSGWFLGLGYLGAAAFFMPAAVAAVHDGSAFPTAQEAVWTLEWMPSFDVNLAFAVDGVGAIFTLIALVIGAFVLFYSTRYLSRGPNYSFYLLMATFTFAMVGLVLTDNLFVLFVCWEITSIASFMLIARSGRAAEGASLRTMFMTFIGGVLLLVAVSAMYGMVGSASIRDVLTSSVWQEKPGFTVAMALLVAIAAMTKSAQFPFQSWLPDAMAAITPVSAYLHAAAVVKAGIFLLFRFSPAFSDVLAWNVLLVSAGIVTAWIGGWCALTQNDLKKLMAYSTVSQLGLIVAAVGVGTEFALTAGLVHVISHAMFKSGLFMMVGVVDHLGHTRTFGEIPRLIKVAPVSFAITAIGAASMAGIPPLMGFVSKEMLLTAVSSAGGEGHVLGWIALVLVAGASVLTISYCIKIVFGAFIDGPEVAPEKLGHNDFVMVTFAALPIVLSVPLAFALGVIEPGVAAGTSAAQGETAHHVHLAMFHGITPELIASFIIIACGVLVALNRARVWEFFNRVAIPFTGADVIDRIVAGLERVGKALVSVVASERASRHVAMNLGFLAVVIFGSAIAIYTGPGLPNFVPNLNRPIDYALLVVITFATLVVCLSRSRLTAVIGLSAVGIMATVQIMALGAPDVTLTQLLVETMTIIVFMLILQKLPRTFWKYSAKLQVMRGIFAIAVGSSVALAVWMLSGRRARSDIAMYYLTKAPEISGGDNIVNTILVEFRALDTQGELAVLGMAGIAIVAVFSSVRDRYIDPPASEVPEMPRRPWLAIRPRGSTAFAAVTEAWPNVIAMQLMVKVVVPFLAIGSLLIFWRGHNEPGGGFIAALVGSAIAGLLYMATSKDRAIGPPRLPILLIGGGVLVAVLTGLVGLIVKGSFLEPIHGYILGQHFTSSMAFDVGVYMAVVGMLLVSFNLLGTSDSAFTPAGDDVLVDGLMMRDVGDIERTRERTDEMLYGELRGPLETMRGAKPKAHEFLEAEKPEDKKRVGLRTKHIAYGDQPKERGE